MPVGDNLNVFTALLNSTTGGLTNSCMDVISFCAWEQTDKRQVTKWKFLNAKNTHRELLIKFALVTMVTTQNTTQNVQGNKLCYKETRWVGCFCIGDPFMLNWMSILSGLTRPQLMGFEIRFGHFVIKPRAEMSADGY